MSVSIRITKWSKSSSPLFATGRAYCLACKTQKYKLLELLTLSIKAKISPYDMGILERAF